MIIAQSALPTHVVAMQKSVLLTLTLLLLATLTGCVVSKTRLLEESAGISDQYFTGPFSYELLDHTHNVLLHLNGKRYVIEENEKPSGFATLHSFRDGIQIMELVDSRASYGYFLLRKTAYGFEVSDLCKEEEKPCEAKTRRELMSKLDLRAKRNGTSGFSTPLPASWTRRKRQ